MRIFITAKPPGYIRVGRDDLIEQYVFLTTSLDGYGSITAAFTPIKVVCQNTSNAAIRSKQNSIKIRHTANAVERLKQAHQLMGISNSLANEMEALFNHWANFQNVRNFENKENKLKSIMWGTGLQRTQTTFNLCQQFAYSGIVQLN